MEVKKEIFELKASDKTASEDRIEVKGDKINNKKVKKPEDDKKNNYEPRTSSSKSCKGASEVKIEENDDKIVDKKAKKVKNTAEIVNINKRNTEPNIPVKNKDKRLSEGIKGDKTGKIVGKNDKN